MTEREFLKELVAVESDENNQEDKKLATDFLDNLGVKELLSALRKKNATCHRGEFSQSLRELIITKEEYYHNEIANTLKVGNHKVRLTYYGIVYNILKYKGCYLKGKNSSPIGITYKKYCGLLQLEDRLKSNNVRKTIANDVYSQNYLLTSAEREKGKKVSGDTPMLRNLENITKRIAYDIEQHFNE